MYELAGALGHGRIVPDGVRGNQGSVRLSPDDDPEKRLHGRGIHHHSESDGADSVRDGPVLKVGRSVLQRPIGLAEPRSAAHPHIDHHRVSVSRDGTGERIRLGAAKPVEALHHAPIRSGHVGAQSLRGDALRVLQGLGLIVRPSDAGRECGDHGRGSDHAPLGADRLQRLREGTGLGVPRLRGLQIGHGSAGQQIEERHDSGGADGIVTVGGAGAHAWMIPRCPTGMQAYGNK